MDSTSNNINSLTCRVKPRVLALATFNANGLKSQIELVREFLITHQIDILAVQETFLKPSVRDPRVANYNIIRDDRVTSRLGGTLIYYRKSLHCTPLAAPPLKNIEATVCQLGMTGHRPVIIASVYLSASKQLLEEDLQALFDMGDSVILTGDLNSKHPRWQSSTTDARGRALNKLTDRLQFEVIAPITPTRFPHGVGNLRHRPSVLDLTIIRNISLVVNNVEVLHELDSDHRPVLIQFSSPQSPTTSFLSPTSSTKKVLNFSKLNKILNSPDSPRLQGIPKTIVTPEEANLAIQELTGHIQDSTRAATREVVAANERRYRLPVEARDLITAKNAATRRFDACPTPGNRRDLNYHQRKVKEYMNEVRNSRWDQLMEGIEPSHVAFWRLARSLKSETVQSMPPLTRPNLPPAFDDLEKAECLADSLESQCTLSTQPADPSHVALVESEVEARLARAPADDPLPPVTLDELRQTLRTMHPKKAPGPDHITNKVVLRLPPFLLGLLVTIFNALLSNCIFPDIWKEADVIGIHKPGKPRNQPASYRPISLLNTFGKIYEKLLLSRLKTVVTTKNLLMEEQFGFRAKHSCVQQVHRLTEHVLVGFHRKRPRGTGALFFDVAKAFDRVWHGGLLYKLYQLGVPDRLVHIIRDFLSNRRFRYRVEGTRSSSHPIRAGVPQGSALSPLLYSLYTSDMPRHPNVELALFADDTALFTTHPLPARITSNLQAAATALGEWFAKWRIEVNPEKSAAIFFNKVRRRKMTRTVTLYNRPIPWAKSVKYLGVILDDRLTFNPHIQRVRNRAAFVLGRLYPLLGKASKMSLRNKTTLYKTCIRPIMSYASVVFAHTGRTSTLQKVQNRFLRMASGCPWYMRNVDLHRDFELDTIAQHMKRLAKTYFESAADHPNRLIVQAASYVPDRDAKAIHRRPRHVLDDPDDIITVANRPLDPIPPSQTLHTHTSHAQRRRRRRRGPHFRTAATRYPRVAGSRGQ